MSHLDLGWNQSWTTCNGKMHHCICSYIAIALSSRWKQVIHEILVAQKIHGTPSTKAWTDPKHEIFQLSITNDKIAK